MLPCAPHSLAKAYGGQQAWLCRPGQPTKTRRPRSRMPAVLCTLPPPRKGTNAPCRAAAAPTQFRCVYGGTAEAARRRSHRCCGASAASCTAPLPSNRHHSGCPATTPTGRIGPPGAKANAVISGILPHCASSTLGCVLNGSQHEGASLVILVHSRLILLAKPRQSLWQGWAWERDVHPGKGEGSPEPDSW